MDSDSPWKEALEVYFQAFMAFFLPPSTLTSTGRGHEFLDKKELQKIAPRAARGRL